MNDNDISGVRIILDKINISNFVNTEYMEKIINSLIIKCSNGCLLGEYGTPTNYYDIEGYNRYLTISIDKSVIRYSDIKISKEFDTIVIHAIPNIIYRDWFTKEYLKDKIHTLKPRYTYIDGVDGIKKISNIITWDLVGSDWSINPYDMVDSKTIASFNDAIDFDCKNKTYI